MDYNRLGRLATWFTLGLFLGGFAVYARADWDTTDKALGAAAVTTLVIDWGQTRSIAKNPSQYYETNSLLGQHPSMSAVNLHFSAAILGTLLIGNYLSPSNRKIFLGTITTVEFLTVGRNNALGIGISF